MRVYVLYDEIGSYYLPRAYRRELAEAGVVILPFRTSQGIRNRFQINFRNHRKIVIVDGHVAYVGGLNVGDEYLGQDPNASARGATRTCEVRGPGRAGDSIRVSRRLVLGHRRRARARLDAQPCPGRKRNRALPGLRPVRRDRNVRAVLHARDQLGQAAALDRQPVLRARRVADVTRCSWRPSAASTFASCCRNIPDHKLVYLAGFSYIAEAEPAGVKFYRYQPGFMHHKVILVDDDLAAVGTANFDNRSIRLTSS